jgi:type VI secretion system protein ImpC
MSGYTTSASARVRFLFCGRFSATPRGRVFRLTRDEFNATLEKAGLELEVEVADRFGEASSRTCRVRFAKLQDFRLARVPELSPELSALAALAKDLSSGDPARRPDATTMLERVATTCGPGRLLATLAAGATVPPAPASAAAPAQPSAAASEVDRIFRLADVSGQVSTTTTTIDRVVAAIRAEGARFRMGPSEAKRSRDTLEQAVYATAADILRHPVTSAIEGAWRGLKLVLDACPTPSDVEIIACDVDAAGTGAALSEIVADEPIDRPDAVFLCNGMEDVEALSAVVLQLAEQNVPVIADLPERWLTPQDWKAKGDSVEKAFQALGDVWATLRASDHSRWLALVANRLVAANEGTGQNARVVWTNPAFVAAAMLTASYKRSGAFGQIFGSQAALTGPALYHPSADSEDQLALEHIISVDSVATLARSGITAFACARNTDRVVCSGFPTVSTDPVVLPMPAQLMIGRIVRFSQWVRDQLPSNADAAEVSRVFDEAAGVFLGAGGANKGFVVAAKLLEKPEPPHAVLVQARVHPGLAGAPIDVAFELALRA